MKLGIVGHGFVGTAVDHGFTKDIQKFIVDPKHNSTNTIEDLIKYSNLMLSFVAVPTPQSESGECNTEILEGVMQQLNNQQRIACYCEIHSASIQVTEDTGRVHQSSG